ncbi:hypothetical protein [Undibacterium sp. Tian12W]|uniref:hypothetical protein n=1 Tax=Undibacterium sp. Tian12W TaxID=3413054 RepID=UPI003BF05F5D
MAVTQGALQCAASGQGAWRFAFSGHAIISDFVHDIPASMISHKGVHMLTIPENIANLMILGLTQEIAQIHAIGETCGDDWPADYDPNDVSVYDSFRQMLKKNAGKSTILDCKNYSKTVAFSIGLLPRFVTENLSQLSIADIESACRVYAQYAAHRCAEMLETNNEHTSERRQVIYMLSQVMAFPGMDSP